jgi:hypothetical protein
VKPRLVALDVAGDVAAWRAAGFDADDDASTVRIGATDLRLDAGATAGAGLTGWTVADAVPDGDGTLEGVPTRIAAPRDDADAPAPAPAPAHPNGVLAIDHVVLATPDTTGTFEALEAAGFALRRVRDAGPDLRQGFFLFAECVLEVVGPPEPRPEGGPASLWGVTLVAPDLTSSAFGPHLGAPRDAVQPGRQIAVFDRAAGLGARVALMTPRADAPAA